MKASSTMAATMAGMSLGGNGEIGSRGEILAFGRSTDDPHDQRQTSEAFSMLY